MRTAVWAHRGASTEAPENTLPAFELAVTQGADGIELDVQRTLDGRLVVCHDETIDRTSTGTGAIKDHSLEQLRCLDFSGGREGFAGVRIPLLSEVFELIRPTSLVINVELKDSVIPYPGMDGQVHRMANQFGLADRVIYSSFNHYTVRALRAAFPLTRAGVLYEEALVEPWDYAARLGATAIHPWYGSFVVPDAVDRAHAAGLGVHAWTLDDPADLRHAFDLHVDAVITNLPALAQEVRAEE